MSSGNVELVRAQWAAWDRKDMDAVAAHWDDDIVLTTADHADWSGQELYQGRAGVMQFLAEWMASWEGYWIVAEAFFGDGDRVLVHVRHGGRRDGVQVEQGWAIIYTLRDGLVVRFEGLSDRALAHRRLSGDQPPIDVVRESWDAWERRDIDHAASFFAADVVHDLSHYPGWPGEAVHVGPGPALHSLAEWMAWWHGYRQDVTGFEESPHGVLVLLRHSGERHGERVEEELGILFEVRDGVIHRWEPWADLDAARARLQTLA